MIRLIVIALLLTGCGSSGGGSSTEPVAGTPDVPLIQPEAVEVEPLTSIWYGDSRCADNTYIESRDCVGGRKLIDLDSIDASYSTIIIHLGFNDMFVATPEQYGAHLEHLIYGIEDKVWCVLPTWANYNRPIEMVSAFREQMISVCINVVDPQIEGYQDDQIHYTDDNHRQAYDVYKSIMDTRS